MDSTNISNVSSEFFVPSSTMNLYLSSTEIGAFILLLGLFGSLGFAQNLVVILSIVMTDGFLDAPANMFVLSLALADFLVCSVSSPLLIYNCYHWIFTTFVTVSKFVVVATTGSIFLVTLNRFVSIVMPLKYSRMMTFRVAASMFGIIWIFACMVPTLAIVGLIYGRKDLVHVTRYFLTFYITSSAIMYVYMYILARIHREKLRKLKYAVSGQIQSLSVEFRALRSLFMIAGSFAACWLPMTISFFFTDRLTGPVQFYRTFCYTSPLVVVNAVLDPSIYFYRSKGFRSSLKLLLTRFKNSALW